jgi:hypothetical protein
MYPQIPWELSVVSGFHHDVDEICTLMGTGRGSLWICRAYFGNHWAISFEIWPISQISMSVQAYYLRPDSNISTICIVDFWAVVSCTFGRIHWLDDGGNIFLCNTGNNVLNDTVSCPRSPQYEFCKTSAMVFVCKALTARLRNSQKYMLDTKHK